MNKDVLYYQKKVDQAIRRLGGYWRPLSGLARVMEELGELNEVLFEEQIDIEELGGEFADLFIITTSIGNQYCMNINDELIQLGYPTTINELYQAVAPIEKKQNGLMQLAIIGGQIARILNHYDGDKKRKPTEKRQRLAEVIAEFQVYLITLAKLYDINLFQYVESILERDLKRDKNRFDITHDPTTETSIVNFRELLGEEATPLKKLWGSASWDEFRKLEDNLRKDIQNMIRFAKSAKIEGLDGFVIQVEGEDIHNDEKRNKILKRIFEFFHFNDPKKDQIVEYLRLSETGLFFIFYEQEFEWIPYIVESSLFLLFTPR